MFVGSLENTARAELLHPLFSRVFAYLKSHDLHSLAAGRVVLDGDSLWMNVDEVQGKEQSEARLEAHDRYIDIQLPLTRSETFGWSDRGSLRQPVGAGYDASRDIIFYHDEPSVWLNIEPGQFIIFFPEDAHAPCVAQGEMKKVVVKVRIQDN